MRLTIFWRVIAAQSAVIALVLVVSLYALARFNQLNALHTRLLTVDSACIGEEKRLLKIFLTEMRNAEKHLVSLDQAFYATFARSADDFKYSLGKIATMADTKREKELVAEIEDLHGRYVRDFELALSKPAPRKPVKGEIGEAILDDANELVRLREQTMMDETAAARDLTISSAQTMAWLTLGGIVAGLLLALLHARGVSLPLKRLAREMHLVGKGRFSRSIEFRAASEVQDLAAAFNRMSGELAQLDKLKSDFTAHVSHELRTPLTAIREGAALLLEGAAGPLTDSQREILEIVHGHGGRLTQSISSLLDLSKMEAEMMEYEFTMTDPADLIHKSVGNVLPIALKKGIDLHADLPDTLPLVYLDERRIGQAMDNLLSNALKFTPEGGEVRVSAAPSEDGRSGGRRLEIRVSDTGAGVPEGDIDRIFDHFYQSPIKSGKNLQGTGLGLAIARHIVEAHHGRIWAENRPGGGASLVFTLPVPLPDGEAPAAMRKEPETGEIDDERAHEEANRLESARSVCAVPPGRRVREDFANARAHRATADSYISAPGGDGLRRLRRIQGGKPEGAGELRRRGALR